ncbi:TRAP mannitol/C4-dicarboxylate transporter [Ketogulonicigenium robustum]|uniref:TRAP mannitol/C4-dicarboxylate transporter n=1 Tax=Ketogulonicigenium robustum TaxID=92947 RepID=A0A1W6NYQ7_9RHOB|nr:TRAP transporter large permease subunit [Ketogulonicigenium robustum]ARO14301.1 TRAP mannitol/C4-dicarboxylate transporter [Ketogulonicigenium robustum]
MMEFIATNMAPIMFASLIIFLLIGYPVAFALAANGLLFFVIGVELAPHSNGVITLSWPLLNALPDRFFGTMSNDTMLAIPFFTFMGVILEKSGMAEDLLDTIGQLFGSIRGGLAFAVVIVGTMLAATTGVVAASVIAMGLISLPIMLRYGYDRSFSAGVIAASGTLAQVVPPSLVLIVLADQLGRSAGDMFKGAMYPALALAGIYLLYVAYMAIFRPHKVPALPPEARTLGKGMGSLGVALGALIILAIICIRLFTNVMTPSNADIIGGFVAVLIVYSYTLLDRKLKWNRMSHLAQQVVIVMVPPVALIFLVLGTIFLGVATPTEAGAMGAAGSLILAAAKRRLNLDVIKQALISTTRLSTFVMFILLGARVFSLTFYGVNGHIWVEHLLTSLPGGATGFIIVVSILVFFLAFFLDYFELAFIIVPLLVAPAVALNIDLVWLGVILAINMQTSFMHPPFGFALHFLRSVAPRVPYIDKITGQKIAPVTSGQIYLGAIPFMALQLLMMVIVIIFPQLVMHYKGPAIDTSSVTISLPGVGGGLGGPSLGGPSLGGPSLGGAGAPGLGAPGLGSPGSLNVGN